MRVADDGADAGKGGDFIGRTLRVASGNDDSSLGIVTAHAADGGAGILIGRCCHRASIENHDVGFGCGRFDQASLFELAFERSAVGLGRAASEILHVIAGHVFYGSVPRPPRVCANYSFAPSVLVRSTTARPRLEVGCILPPLRG